MSELNLTKRDKFYLWYSVIVIGAMAITWALSNKLFMPSWLMDEINYFARTLGAIVGVYIAIHSVLHNSRRAIIVEKSEPKK